MGMQFCKACKGLLVKEGNRWICLNCKEELSEEISISSSEKLFAKRQIEVVNEKDDLTLPKTDWVCPKCGNKEAYFWHLITTASDEADTVYHKCTKCGLTVQKGGQRGGR